MATEAAVGGSPRADRGCSGTRLEAGVNQRRLDEHSFDELRDGLLPDAEHVDLDGNRVERGGVSGGAVRGEDDVLKGWGSENSTTETQII